MESQGFGPWVHNSGFSNERQKYAKEKTVVTDQHSKSVV
jgi:hypothetical protein